ncbi:MAG: acyltransferase [Oligoflexia bacterium]|nr:acyltransferase [Oligoflexia bacterium]
MRKKFHGASLRELAYLEIEAFLQGLAIGIPGAPGFFIRFWLYKLLFKKLGTMAWVSPQVRFLHTHKLRVGNTFSANSGSYINAVGGITLGDFVLIGTNVTIVSGIHPIEGPLPPVFARPVETKPVTIEDDVWIGSGAVILAGSHLRRGTVVGANSVVSGETEEYSVVAGSPARKIRSR